jgi:hypothetical protein
MRDGKMLALPKWLRFKFRSRTLAASGIFLTIASALIGHVFVSELHSNLAVLRRDISSIDRSISESWQQLALIEQRKNFSTMLAVVNTDSMPAEGRNLVKAYYAETAMQTSRRSNLADLEPAAGGGLESPSQNSNFADVLQILAEERDNVAGSITAYNAEKLDAMDKAESLENQSRMFSYIAFFMQVLGLMLFMAQFKAVLQRKA